jgi:iron complex outermembrane receptor protein
VGGSSHYGPEPREYFLRGTVKYVPSDLFDAKLKASFTRYDDNGGIGYGNELFACALGAPTYVVLLNSPGSRNCTLGRYTNAANFAPNVAQLSPFFNGGQLFELNHQFLGSLSMNLHPTKDLTISSVTGYWAMRNAYFANFSWGNQAWLGGAFATDDKQFSQEIRLASKYDFPINFMVGAYLQHEQLSSDGASPTDSLYTRLFTGLAPQPAIIEASIYARQDTTAWSGFAQLLGDVTEQIQVTAGGRYSHEEKRIAALTGPTAFSATGYLVNIVPDERTFTNFSPEATITYKLSHDITFYGAYRQGFKSGGFDISSSTGAFGNVNPGNISYDQETAKGGEIGMKGTVADGTVLVDVSAYTYKYSGLQVSSFNSAILAFGTTNAAAARVEGLDLALKYKPQQVEGLTLRTAVNLNNAHYLTYNRSPCYAGQSQAAGCDLITSAGPGGGVLVTPATPTTVRRDGRPISAARTSIPSMAICPRMSHLTQYTAVPILRCRRRTPGHSRRRRGG